MNTSIVIKADENINLIRNRQEEKKLRELYPYNAIKYVEYDKVDSQLKMFFGFDSENPETLFYPDSLIIEYSDYVRDMYKLKLNDITIKK